MCDVVGCDEQAEWYDDTDSQLCDSCMAQDMAESGKRLTDYELMSILASQQADSTDQVKSCGFCHAIDKGGEFCYQCGRKL